MEKRHWIVASIIALGLAGGAISGCVTAENGGQGIVVVEEMTDVQFSKWKLYISLTAKVTANRLLSEGVAQSHDLEVAALALEMLRDDPVVPSAGSVIQPILNDLGLTNAEVELILVLVEQELLSRGGFRFIDTDTGTLLLSDRTKELLTAVADSLRAATVVTPVEVETTQKLQSEFE